MTGSHGHVVSRSDGLKARCGGPALCAHCAAERAAINSVPKQGNTMNPTAIENIVKGVLPMIQLAVPFVGPQAHDLAERALTVPESSIRKLASANKLSEADTVELVAIFRDKIADGLSDALVLIASRGAIQPD